MTRIDELINQLRAARDKAEAEQRKADEKVAPFKETAKALEDQLIDAMVEAGTTSGRSEGFSATMGKSVLPRITDSNKFDKYVARHKAFHLFERRIARNNFAEWLDTHPMKDLSKIGVESFTKTTINIRALGAK